MLSIGIGLTSVPVLARRGPVYDPYAAALFARLPATPSALRRKLVNDLIVNLRDNAIFETKDDTFYMPAMGMDDPGYTTANDAFAARRNWIQDAYNLTAVGSPSFTTDRGYAGDGAGAYLSTGFNPATAPSPKYSQNDAHVSVGVRTNVASDAAADIGITNAYIRSLRVSTQAMTGPLNSSAVFHPLPAATSIGQSLVTRSGSVDINGYRDGVFLGAIGQVSAAPASMNFQLLAVNGANFSTRQITTASIGKGLSPADVSALTAARNAYLTAVGA